MRQDYAFDKMAQYAIEQIDGNFEVVNPEYNRLDYRLKKTREKISRRLAQLYNLEHENINGKLDESGKNNARQVMLEKEMEELKGQEQTMLEERNALSYNQNNTLTVELYSLSTPRENIAAKEMCNILNKQNAIYPDTNLRLYYKIAT